MKKLSLFLFLSLFAISLGTAQSSILTAANFFKSVSDTYARIRDYEANIDIKANKTNMNGKVSFKQPSLLRIDFNSPKNQVICFNGDMLTIYLPESSAILNQSVQGSGNGGANLATPQGLALMSRYYSVAYENSPNPVPLGEGSEENVIKLILSRRNTTEAFRYIKLAVLPDSKLIRRIEGITPQGVSFVFTFSNYALNQGISDQRFIYDPPTSANNYNNFLYSE